MLRRTVCQVDVSVDFEPVDPILIKSGYATMDGPDMVPVVTYRDGKSTYYFPGSSLKGVLRSHLERIARTLVPGSVCIPYFDPKKDIPIPVASERNSHGCGYRSSATGDSGKDPSSVAYGDSCAACRMFGSLKFAGRFSIGDAYPLEGHAPVLEQRNGVGIDRFTGGTVRGVLFDLQALVGGRFRAEIRLLNFELWQLAALNLLLVDLADTLIAVGSGRSRGLGRIRGEVDSYRLSYLHNTDHLAGLWQLATDEERAAYQMHDWTPAAAIRLPEGQRRGLRALYDLNGDWQQRLEPLVPAFEAFLAWHGGPQGQVAHHLSEEGRP